MSHRLKLGKICNKPILFISMLTFYGTITGADEPSRSHLLPKAQRSPHEKKHIPKPYNAVVGIIEKIKGKAQVQRGGRIIPASIGLRLFEKDVLETMVGRFHIRFNDGAYMELSDHTKLEIERLRLNSKSKTDVIFDLREGSVRLLTLKASHKQFIIHTMSSIIRIPKNQAGSEVYLVQSTDKLKELSFAVIQGAATVISVITNASLDLKPYSGAQVKITGLVKQTSSLSQDQIDYLRSQTRI